MYILSSLLLLLYAVLVGLTLGSLLKAYSRARRGVPIFAAIYIIVAVLTVLDPILPHVIGKNRVDRFDLVIPSFAILFVMSLVGIGLSIFFRSRKIRRPPTHHAV